jgi:choloylglycine hydrolase
VIASDTKLRITRKSTPLHYLVADAGGNVASIEFLEGVMVVHRDKDLPFPVLTNDTYASSVETAKPLVGKAGVALENNSLDRFVKACSMVKKFNETDSIMPVSDFAFSILDKVSQGSFTKWSIVYDISNKKIQFKTEANKTIKTVSFSAFDLACNKPYKMFNMNQDGAGDVSSRFIVADKKIKAQIMAQVAAESSSRIAMSKKEEEELLSYEESVTCKQ